MDLEQFSLVVASLYDTALDSTAWARLAPMVAQAFATDSCTFQVRDLVTGSTTMLGLTANYDAKARVDYETYYHRKDLWAAGAAKLVVGRPGFGQEAVSDSELLSSEFYNDYCREIGLFHAMGCAIAVDDHTLGVIGILRPHGAEAFDNSDKRNLGLLLPHLTRAMQFHRRLGVIGREQRIGFAAMESLAVGAMAVEADGRLVFANSAAESILRAAKGLTVRHGILHACDRRREKALHQAIGQAAVAVKDCLSSPGGILNLERPEGRPLSLLVCPMRPESIGIDTPRPMVMIFTSDPDDEPRLPHKALADLWGLTAAEARLTAALLEGEYLEGYASRRGISMATVKTQLRQVFAKTDCTRQSELIRVLLANPVLRMCREPKT